VTDSSATLLRPGSKYIFQNLVGRHTFHLTAISLAAVVFALGRLTVYAANESEYFSYVASAIAISETLVTISLLALSTIIFRTPWEKSQPYFALVSIAVVNALGTFAFEGILRNWNIEPISQTVFQRIVSLLFTTFIYLGFGQVLQVLDGNFRQVRLAKSLLVQLSKQQLEVIQEIREARTFSIREISLEIQATLGTIENVTATDLTRESFKTEIIDLQNVLLVIEDRINQIRNRFPGSVRMPKAYAKFKYSVSLIISASSQPNRGLPVLISVVSFFGFCSWLSYFMDEVHAAFWGGVLSAISFGIFFGYEKYIATKLLAKSVIIRISVFEMLVITYLFFWLLILGFFAGDDSNSYGAALAYAAIPFIFFNGGAVLGGVIASSQNQREQLTKQAATLRSELAALEQVRADEDKVWKSLFAGDIALSPTTANVILRDAAKSNEHELVVSVISKVNEVWKSVLIKLSSLA